MMPDAQTVAEISDVVRTYIEGMCTNDPERLRAAMHQNACSIGHYKGVLEWETREVFIDAVAATVKTPDPAPWHVINSVSVTGEGSEKQIRSNLPFRPKYILVETHGVHGAPTDEINGLLQQQGYATTDLGIAEPCEAANCVDGDIRVLAAELRSPS